jgi:hypothetical protein
MGGLSVMSQLNPQLLTLSCWLRSAPAPISACTVAVWAQQAASMSAVMPPYHYNMCNNSPANFTVLSAVRRTPQIQHKWKYHNFTNTHIREHHQSVSSYHSSAN